MKGILELLKEHNLESCRLAGSEDCEEHPRAVRAAVEAFAADQDGVRGWLCLQSGIVCFEGSIPADGIIQYGEIAGGDAGLLIRRGPNSTWRLIRLQEGSGAEVLAGNFHHLGRPDLRDGSHYQLLYRCYWKQDPEFGYLPYASRFTGFAPLSGGLS